MNPTIFAKQLFVKKIIKNIIKQDITYLDYAALKNISDAVFKIERSKVSGQFIEAGCALGGSGILIAKMKKRSRKLHIYDAFGMIPPPGINDDTDVHARYHVIEHGNAAGINGTQYYGYVENLHDKVVENFKRNRVDVNLYNINLVKGLYEDTVRIKTEVAFAHIDCDWYDSVMVCLREVVPQLNIGGILIVDDYHTWSGCKKAVNEYFREKKNEFIFSEVPRMTISRVKFN